jgi:hypothetical protein
VSENNQAHSDRLDAPVNDLSERADEIDKLMVFASWAIPSRSFGWGFLGLLCGFAAFSALMISGSFHFRNPDFNSYGVFFLPLFAVVGASLLGALGYKRGVRLIVQYALQSLKLGSAVCSRLLGDCQAAKHDPGELRSSLLRAAKVFPGNGFIESLVTSERTKTQYRTKTLQQLEEIVVNQVVAALLQSPFFKGGASKLSFKQFEKDAASRMDGLIEDRLNQQQTKVTRRLIFTLFVIYASVPVALVIAGV